MSSRILFVAFEVPYPLDRGGRFKTFHFLRALASKNKVTLLALVRSEQQMQDLAEQFSFCEDVVGVAIDLSLRRKLWRLTLSLPRRKPFIISLYDLPQMHHEIQRLLSQRKYDMFYYDHLHMAQYRPARVDALHVLDQHNIESVLLQRIYGNMRFRPEKAVAWLEWLKMKHYEPRICQEMDCVLTTTKVDASVLCEWGLTPQRVRAIPIGVDTDYFQANTNISKSCKNLTAIGTLGWPPNAEGILWFYHDVLPQVKQVVPGVHFNIIGDQAPQEIAALNQDPSVSVLGYVDDIRPYMADSAALLVALRTGSGMRVKILNGMAMGVPIISTSVGCEGIAALDGEHLLKADQPQDFARAAISLLEKPDLRQRLASQGREFVDKHYGWERVYEMIEAWSEELLA